MNEAIATAGNNALVLDTADEQSLDLEISFVEQRASCLEVTDGTSSEVAMKFRKEIKGLQKKITEYWEPLRVDAKKAYDNVLAKKKEMMSPLEKADKILSQKINAYAYQVEMERRRQEEERRRLLEEEINRKLAEAAEAEDHGDAVGAEMAMAEAEVFDSVSAQAPAAPAKLNGASQKIGWEITYLNPVEVPISICGVEVRIGNKAVVQQLVQQAIERSNGKVSIPGVRYQETMKVNVRT